MENNEQNIIEEAAELTPAKRAGVRIFSAIIFIFLVWLVVWGTDFAVNFISNLF